MLTFSHLPQAQILIKPGDPSIHYDWLIPSHDFYKVIVFDSTGRKTLEIMNEQIQAIDSMKHTILSTRTRQVPFGRWMIDTSICTAALVPLRMHEFDQPKTFEHDFRFAVIPFEKGKQYRLNSFRIGRPGTLNPYDIEYVFDDTWGQSGDNDLNCNVLRFKNSYSSGYIWINHRTHKMVKEYIQMDSGDKVIIVER